MPAATGVRWRPRTSVTAPPLRSQWRVSEWKKNYGPPWPQTPGFHARRRYDGDPNVLLLSLQPRNRGSKLIFCLLSRGRKCSGGGAKCYDKGAMKKCIKHFYSLTLSFCVTGIVCKLAHQVQKDDNLCVSRWAVFSHETRRFYFFMSNFLRHKPTWLS